MTEQLAQLSPSLTLEALMSEIRGTCKDQFDGVGRRCRAASTPGRPLGRRWRCACRRTHGWHLGAATATRWLDVAQWRPDRPSHRGRTVQWMRSDQGMWWSCSCDACSVRSLGWTWSHSPRQEASLQGARSWSLMSCRLWGTQEELW